MADNFKWPSGDRDTTEFPKIDVSIDVSLRTHLQAFCNMDGLGWNDYGRQRDAGGLTVEDSRMRTNRKMYERLGLIYKDNDTIRLSQLGNEINSLERKMNEYKLSVLNEMRAIATRVLSRYQLRNPVDDPRNILGNDCDVQPFLCIWKIMRGLDNKINHEELNRVIMRISKMEDIDSAIAKIRNARNVLRTVAGVPTDEQMDSVLGERTNDDQPQARMAAWFSLAGWGGLLIRQQVDHDGYRQLVPEAISFIDSVISNPPVFYRASDEEDWRKYYIGEAAVEITQTIVNNDDNERFSLNALPDAFDNGFARRFITSLLAKPFVILTGNSGTGKTRIAKQFAEYLTVIKDGEKNWLIVPVGADWTDNSRIMGFFNPLADNGVGKYEKTAIIRLIERANRYPHLPFFLILDEMNLSHVERYFSDFLSHMETPDRPFEIEGYRADDVTEEEPGAEGNEIGVLAFPENLFVIGTVNIDETTYMFSPKVLDRANVIEFKPEKASVMNLFTGARQDVIISRAGEGVAESFLTLAEEIRSGAKSADNGTLDMVRRVFADVYGIAEEKGYEFAYRTAKEIRNYVNASYSLTEEGQWDAAKTEKAIDEQLLQKVLPKVHGNKKEISDMLNKLEEFCSNDGRNLTLSAAKIKQMKGRLDTIQYASYI